MILDAIAQFLNIKGKREEEKLHFIVPFAAEQESAEGVILFENAECALDLNGTVDAEQNTFITDDIVKGLFAVFHELVIDLDLPEAALAFVAFAR